MIGDSTFTWGLFSSHFTSRCCSFSYVQCPIQVAFVDFFSEFQFSAAFNVKWHTHTLETQRSDSRDERWKRERLPVPIIQCIPHLIEVWPNESLRCSGCEVCACVCACFLSQARNDDKIVDGRKQSTQPAGARVSQSLEPPDFRVSNERTASIAQAEFGTRQPSNELINNYPETIINNKCG